MKFSLPTSVALLVLSAALAACSSGESRVSGSDESTGGGSAATQRAKDDVLKYQDVDSLVFPEITEPVDPGSRQVAIISCGQTGISCAQMSGYVQEAAEAAGWDAAPTYDGAFDPRVQAGYVQQAVNDGVDAVILVSIDASSISAAIDAANAAGVPVVCGMCVNHGMEDKVIDVAPSTEDEGRAIAALLATHMTKPGKVVGFNDRTFPLVAERVELVGEVLPDYCVDCTWEMQEFPVSDLAQPGPPTWTGFLSANPAGTVAAAVAPYDAMALPAVKSSKQAGRDELPVAGFDGYPEFVQSLVSGEFPAAVATVSEPLHYMAYATVDLAARSLEGMDLWDSSELPIILVTEDNAADFTDGYVKPSFDPAAMFGDLWGRS